MTSAPIRRLLAVAAALLLVAAACGDDDDTGSAADGDAPAGATELSGLLRLDAGSCDDAGAATGSTFRMVQSGGTIADGPFVPNGDSPCADQTYTPLAAGSDGGLLLGQHQPTPDPAFDDAGNAIAGQVTEPTTWFAVGFATATNEVDPQTGVEVAAPVLTVDENGTVTGDLRAFAASWNGQHFNQGAPKPDGSSDGNTSAPTGTYDVDTGALVIEWTSQISGGAFDGFTGVWRLEGTLETS